MDPVSPFRVLSPGNRKPKTPQPPRYTKLSLKYQSGMKGKENQNSFATRGHVKKPNLRSVDSELLTSDESDSSVLDIENDEKKHSVLSLNTQESNFSLPIAESTRCEMPKKLLNELVESTVISLHTASIGSSSSGGTEYHTAHPFPNDCDESIVCISDSSPESVKKSVKTGKKPFMSVLLTSDDSDDGSNERSRKYLLDKAQAKKKLCETVILESDSDDNIGDTSDENNIVIPPSVRSFGSSPNNSVRSYDSDIRKIPNDIVIPPSPERYSETNENRNNSLISEDGQTHNLQQLEMNKKEISQKYPTESDITESSWKDDFRLVLQESTLNCHESQKIDCHHNSEAVPSSLSKEKYDNIARWLHSGSESESNPVGNSTGNAVRLSYSSKSQQKLRSPDRRKCSSDSDSDDKFEALMDSIRKKHYNGQKKQFGKNDGDSFINDDSLLNHSSNDENHSPLNIYHSDLTKSIKAEVKSVKKSVKSLKKRHLFNSYSDSDEDSEDFEKSSKECEVNSRNALKVKPPQSDSNESSDNGDSNTRASKKGAPFPEKVVKKPTVPSSRSKPFNTKPKHTSKTGHLNSIDSSDAGESDAEEPVIPIADWRRNDLPSSGSNSESSSSSIHKPKKPQQVKTKEKKTELPKFPFLTPAKKVASLKTPGTPYSPIRTFLSSLSGPSRQQGVRDHPEAAVYNKNFKGKKEELTRRLFKLFNREVFDRRLPEDMVLEWNARLVRTAGLCYCKLMRKGGITSRTSKIALSTKVITSPDRLRDTLIHEMCHAAVWLLNNVSGGHGPFWKAWAQKAMKRFPELPPIERCHTYNIETKFTYKCTKCGYSFGRHSKSLDLDKKRCGYCYGTFEVFLTSKDPAKPQNSQEKALKTPKAPNAFALFVKENYGLIKHDNNNLKHGDIMKKLSEKFASLKVVQQED